MNIITKLKKLIPADFPLRLWYHRATGFLAALVYGFPARKLIVIGVTGTNGKTTTTHLITEILEAANKRVGMASTVRFKIGETEWRNSSHKTTMGRFGLQQHLKKMVQADCEYAVLEVSSHALVQGRLIGVPFDVAVFTNLSREHLDFHHTMDQYRDAKGLLFKHLKSSRRKKIKGREIFKSSIVNLDDLQAPYYLNFHADQKWGFSLQGVKATANIDVIHGEHVEATTEGIDFSLQINGQSIPIHSPLLGGFNVYNLLAGAAVGLSQGIYVEIIKHTLENFTGVVGRMEPINVGQPFKVFIDYAVTPDSFELLFKGLRPFTPSRIIAVFGACGDRDHGKRPLLGEVAGTLADLVIVTNEEPYTEDPEKIIASISHGVLKSGKLPGKDFWTIPDRREAIKHACHKAKEGDTIVITGMGDQDSMVVGTTMVPWSDREVVKEILVEMYLKKRISLQ